MLPGSHSLTHSLSGDFEIETARRPVRSDLVASEKPAPSARRRQGPASRLVLAWILAACTGSMIVQAVLPVANGTLVPLATGSIDRKPPEPIDRLAAVALSRAVLLRLDDASRTGNYAVFRDMAAPAFQAMNSAADLERIFAWMRNDGLKLTSAAALDAASLRPTTMEKGGILHVRGALPDIPGGLSFDLLMQQSTGEWRVFGIAVYRG